MNLALGLALEITEGLWPPPVITELSQDSAEISRTPDLFSTSYWVHLTIDDDLDRPGVKVVLSLERYDQITWGAYENRTEEVVLDLADPGLVATARRIVGDHLVLTSGADRDVETHDNCLDTSSTEESHDGKASVG